MGSWQSNRTLLGFPADEDEPPQLPWWFGTKVSEKVEPVAHGLHECCCTESIACDSCDEALEPEEAAAGEMVASTAPVDEEEEVEVEEDGECSLRLRWLGNRRKRAEKQEFPPPLRWMAGIYGQRAGVLRSERKDGRLVITEVRSGPPGVLLAFREVGRFRLYLIRWDGFDNRSNEAKQEPEEGEKEKLSEDKNSSEEISSKSEDEEEEEEEAAAAAVVRWELERGKGGSRKCEEAVSVGHPSPIEWWMPTQHLPESPTAWWGSTHHSCCLTPA